MECSPAGTRTKESQKRNDGASADYIVINVRSRLQRISYICSKAYDVVETKAVKFNQPNKVWKKGSNLHAHNQSTFSTLSGRSGACD